MRFVVVVAVLLLSLAGCVPGPPSASPSPSVSASATPVFASEEEALAAAEEAYRAYVSLADLIFTEGGANAHRLSAVAVGDFYDEAVVGFEEVEKQGWRSTGGTTFRNFSLQIYDQTASESILIAYVCEDVSAVDVVDAQGVSIVSPDRPDSTLLQVTFDLGDGESLLVSGREAWNTEPC